MFKNSLKAFSFILCASLSSTACLAMEEEARGPSKSRKMYPPKEKSGIFLRYFYLVQATENNKGLGMQQIVEDLGKTLAHPKNIELFEDELMDMSLKLVKSGVNPAWKDFEDMEILFLRALDQVPTDSLCGLDLSILRAITTRHEETLALISDPEHLEKDINRRILYLLIGAKQDCEKSYTKLSLLIQGDISPSDTKISTSNIRAKNQNKARYDSFFSLLTPFLEKKDPQAQNLLNRILSERIAWEEYSKYLVSFNDQEKPERMKTYVVLMRAADNFNQFSKMNPEKLKTGGSSNNVLKLTTDYLNQYWTIKNKKYLLAKQNEIQDAAKAAAQILFNAKNCKSQGMEEEYKKIIKLPGYKNAPKILKNNSNKKNNTFADSLAVELYKLDNPEVTKASPAPQKPAPGASQTAKLEKKEEKKDILSQTKVSPSPQKSASNASQTLKKEVLLQETPQTALSQPESSNSTDCTIIDDEKRKLLYRTQNELTNTIAMMIQRINNNLNNFEGSVSKWTMDGEDPDAESRNNSGSPDSQTTENDGRNSPQNPPASLLEAPQEKEEMNSPLTQIAIKIEGLKVPQIFDNNVDNLANDSRAEGPEEEPKKPEIILIKRPSSEDVKASPAVSGNITATSPKKETEDTQAKDKKRTKTLATRKGVKSGKTPLDLQNITSPGNGIETKDKEPKAKKRHRKLPKAPTLKELFKKEKKEKRDKKKTQRPMDGTLGGSESQFSHSQSHLSESESRRSQSQSFLSETSRSEEQSSWSEGSLSRSKEQKEPFAKLKKAIKSKSQAKLTESLIKSTLRDLEKEKRISSWSWKKNVIASTKIDDSNVCLIIHPHDKDGPWETREDIVKHFSSFVAECHPELKALISASPQWGKK